MIDSRKNVCIIPARGGSKRIPRKNIRSFSGKPIIAYSIDAALQSKCFGRVVVSTDDEEIAEVAKEYGATVPFIRPAALADDHTGTLEVVNHAVTWIKTHLQPYIHYVCCLYATAPFTTPESLISALNKLRASPEKQFCFSVAKFRAPIQRAFKLSDNRGIEMFYPECYESRSQDLATAYYDAGQFYWGKVSAFSENPSLYSDLSIAHILPDHLVQDIDTEEDWHRAERLYQLQSNHPQS